MRRRGTMLTCDICTQSIIFVKNLKPYNESGWKFVRKAKIDICPKCVLAKAIYEKRHNTKLTWYDLRELLYRDNEHTMLN